MVAITVEQPGVSLKAAGVIADIFNQSVQSPKATDL